MFYVRCFAILQLLLLSAAAPEDALTRHLRKANEYVLVHTHYHTHWLPKVVWVSRIYIARLTNQKPCNEDGHEYCTSAAEKQGIVYLRREYFTLGEDDNVLVHELVHFQQDTNGHESACLGVLEKEAYAIEAQYMKETGKGDMPDAQYIAAISRKCHR